MTHDDKEGRGGGDTEPSLVDKLALLMDVRRQPDGSRWNGAALARGLEDKFDVKVSKEMLAGILRGTQQNPGANTRNGLAELLGVPLEYLAEPLSDRIRRIAADVHQDLLRRQAGGDTAEADEAMLTTSLVLGVNQQVKMIAAGIAEETGLTSSQAEALLQLANTKHSMTLSEFCTAYGKTSPTMTRIAKALEALELICQCPLETDQRVRRISITPKGQEIVDRHTQAPAAAAIEAMDLASMDAAQRAVVLKVLGALASWKDTPAAGAGTAAGEVDRDSPGPPHVRGVA